MCVCDCGQVSLAQKGSGQYGYAEGQGGGSPGGPREEEESEGKWP